MASGILSYMTPYGRPSTSLLAWSLSASSSGVERGIVGPEANVCFPLLRTLRNAIANTRWMSAEYPDPLAERAAHLRQATPQLVADVAFYPTADGGKTQAALPGWGCPCMVSREGPLLGYDGWPVLDAPLHPGERRSRVPFVFLSPESGEVVRRAGRFYLWDGGFIGEATVVS
jgi:hypothetical protein